MNTKSCPTRECGALIRINALLCSECWRRLPKELLDQLNWVVASTWTEPRIATARDAAIRWLNSQRPLPTQHEARYG